MLKRFAQVMIPIDHEIPVDPRIKHGEHLYAITYEDGGKKIPEHCKIKLENKDTVDMHGTPMRSFMLQFDEVDVYHAIDSLGMDAYPRAVHAAPWQMQNGQPNIIRNILPVYEVYLTGDNRLAATIYRDDLRKTLIRTVQEKTDGSLESLKHFKHMVVYEAIPSTKHHGFRYTLPSNVPSDLLKTLEYVNVAVPDTRRREEKKDSLTFRLAHTPKLVLPFRSRLKSDPAGIISEFPQYRLHDQEYLGDQANKSLIHLPLASSTCEDKLAVLRNPAIWNPIREKLGLTQQTSDWRLDNIISAQFFHHNGMFAALIGPRMNEIRHKDAIIRENAGAREWLQDRTPRGMERGTCTPFLPLSIADTVEKIILLDLPEHIMKQPADYSVGGYGPSAHRASLHISPNEATSLLKNTFGEKIISVRHPYQSYWL